MSAFSDIGLWLGGIKVSCLSQIIFILLWLTIPPRHATFFVLPPMRFSRVASCWCPCVGLPHSLPLWLHRPCVQQYFSSRMPPPRPLRPPRPPRPRPHNKRNCCSLVETVVEKVVDTSSGTGFGTGFGTGSGTCMDLPEMVVAVAHFADSVVHYSSFWLTLSFCVIVHKGCRFPQCC